MERFYSVKTDTSKRAILCAACAADAIDLEEATLLRPRADYTCVACEDAINPRDEDYERAVAHARSNDWAETNGNDWS